MSNRVIRALLIALLLPSPLFAINTAVSLGAHIGLAPDMGGNLQSRVQRTELGVDNGIDGINRSMDGVKTEKINKLLGAYGGMDFKVVFAKYFLFRLQTNFVMNFFGGTGVTLDQSENRLTAKYSLWIVDIPVGLGVSVPFGDIVRISLCGGVAFAYGSYSNSFKSSTVNSSATFETWTFPWLIMLSGEYFFREDIAITTSLAYYQGSSDVIKSRSDYAKIDFSGFRWNIGFSYYFIKKKKKE
ncbi:MAG TPA: hypothetical protein PK859_19120 [Spirochaetota bacterium]|nr:hypothetical protein [Spirochaetota bacterium]